MSSFFKTYKQTGFTLIEMLVVIGIFLVISGILMANLPKFRDKTNVELIAQEVAITIRQAQVYGTGVRAFGTEFPSYGIYLNSGANGNNKKMVLFGDLDKEEDYDYNSTETEFACGGDNNECLEVFSIQGSAEIRNVCIEDNCGASSNKPLNIVYVRPNLEAHFAGEDCSGCSNANFIRVIIGSSRSDDERSVTVFKNGQIRVEEYE